MDATDKILIVAQQMVTPQDRAQLLKRTMALMQTVAGPGRTPPTDLEGARRFLNEMTDYLQQCFEIGYACALGDVAVGKPAPTGAMEAYRKESADFDSQKLAGRVSV